jgi:integrase
MTTPSSSPVSAPGIVAFDESYSPSTRRCYGSDWRLFVAWCEGTGNQPLPASDATVSAYVEAKADALKPASVVRHTATIAAVHRDSGLPDPSKTRAVRVSLKKMYRKKGRRQDQAVAINFDLRNRMLAAAPDSRIGARDRALLAVAYDLGCRRAELVGLAAEDLLRGDDGSATALLRRSKTDQFGEGHVRYLAPDTVGLVDAWLDVSGIEDGPIFRSVDRHGKVGGPLPAAEVSRIWKKMARAAAAPEEQVRRISGHSTRVGMAQDMAETGIDLASIMQAGGWRTPHMVARYIERLNARSGAAAKLAAKQNRAARR